MSPDRPTMTEHRFIENQLKKWFKRWRVWVAIYVLGFLVLWLTGLAETEFFYAWSIGWALVWALWKQNDDNDDFEKFIARKRHDVERDQRKRRDLNG